MADCKFSCGSASSGRENVCIEAGRILDSCRDRDCFENVRVLLTRFGNDVIAHTSTVRTKCAEIAWASIGLSPIQFNRGFYSVNIRLYIKLVFEACVPGGAREFDGIAVVEKNVILFGGENSSRIFRSKECGSFCASPEPVNCSHNAPEAVFEVVEPVILGTRVIEEKECCVPVCCGCACCDIPECVCCQISDSLCDEAERYLAVSIGLFSVVRLIRSGQFVVSASEFAIPDKECIEPKVSDPCSVFRKMPFPVGDFGIQGHAQPCHEEKSEKRCGC